MDSAATLQLIGADSASHLQLWGAGAFGVLIGWYVYFINRHRTAEVQLGDLVTLIGVIGGGAILTLFKAETDLFGAYGIGLAVGFFLYFLVLIFLVGVSKNFDADWFLDGRRKKPIDPYYIPTRDEVAGQSPTAMGAREGGGAGGGGGGGGAGAGDRRHDA